MKRSLFLVVVCSGFALGCGSHTTEVSKSMEKAHKTEFPVKGESKSTPEFIADHAETAAERANYLKGLSSDAKFDPKQHVEMLKKYENDSNSDVATAAKELLAKAQ